MKPDIRKLRFDLQKKCDEADQFLNDGDISAAQKAYDEATEIEKSLALAEKTAEIQSKRFTVNPLSQAVFDNGERGDTSGGLSVSDKAFADATKRRFVPTEDERKSYLNEGINTDGGYLVPQDIQTTINEYKSDSFSVLDYIDKEYVNTNTGSRVYHTREQLNGFREVAEGGGIPGAGKPQFSTLNFQIKKYSGFTALTNELIDDASANTVNFLKDWLGSQRIATCNRKTFELLKSNTAIEFTSIDSIEDQLNITLGSVYKSSTALYTNANGYSYFTKRKDENGRKLLDRDSNGRPILDIGGNFIPIIEAPTQYLPNEDVYTMTKDSTISSDKQYYTRSGSGTNESPYTYSLVAEPNVDDIKTYYEVTDKKIPMILGSLFDAVKMFDRKALSIKISDSATVGSGESAFNAFENDGTILKGTMRADFKIKDSDAFVNGYMLNSVATA
ncbi:MAG: phage major capsid protein [Acutalibacteraceae bacterium]